MPRRTRTLDPAYFDALYALDPDPWKFASSAYERKKYAVTLAAMPKPRYARGLEIGCSIGVLTRELAARCDAILGVDVAQAPLTGARFTDAPAEPVNSRVSPKIATTASAERIPSAVSRRRRTWRRLSSRRWRRSSA